MTVQQSHPVSPQTQTPHWCNNCPRIGLAAKVLLVAAPICAALGIVFSPLFGICTFTAIIVTTMFCTCKKSKELQELQREINNACQIENYHNNPPKFNNRKILKFVESLDFTLPKYILLEEIGKLDKDKLYPKTYLDKIIQHLTKYYLPRLLEKKGYSKPAIDKIKEISEEIAFECATIGSSVPTVLEAFEKDMALLDYDSNNICDIHEFTLLFLNTGINLMNQKNELNEKTINQILAQYNLNLESWNTCLIQEPHGIQTKVEKFLVLVEESAPAQYNKITEGQKSGIYIKK